MISSIVNSSNLTVEELSKNLTDDAVSSFSIVEDGALDNASYEGYILRGITKAFELDSAPKIRIEFIKQN